mgnify:CR=1 FL=1
MLEHSQRFDVIVVGAGHAGCEAAAAAARMGAATLLLTQSVETIGQMSCNPAIGGIGKSQLVREIDALDGLMARAADEAGIHFRVLNASKGPAVRATRAQADRALYRQAMRRLIEHQDNLQVFQQSVVDLVVEAGHVVGVDTQMGLRFRSGSVVLTTGTFLGGRIHIGLSQHQGGRAGDAPSNALAERLRALPFRVGRLKTGTPPRIDGRSVDFSVMEQQPGAVNWGPWNPAPARGVLRLWSHEAFAAGAEVVIRIADRGPGVAVDQLERIFEPFFTTKDAGKGTGLGLSQIFAFVRQLDGVITIFDLRLILIF